MRDWFSPQLTADEERAVAAFMARLAAVAVPETDVQHGPGAIWWKAQLLRRWHDQQRAARPVAMMEPIQVGAGLVAAALVFFWALPSVMQTLSTTLRAVLPAG